MSRHRLQESTNLALKQLLDELESTREDAHFLRQNAEEQIKNLEKEEHYEVLKSGLSEMANGLQRLNKGSKKDAIFGVLGLVVGVGKITGLAFPAAGTIFGLAATALGKFGSGEKNMGEIVCDIIEDAFRQHEDRSFKEKFSGVQNMFKTSHAFLTGVKGRANIVALCAMVPVYNGDSFLGELTEKINETRRLTEQKSTDQIVSNIARKALLYIDLFCKLTVARLCLLHQFYLVILRSMERDENEGIAEGVKAVIEKQRKDVQLVLGFLANPKRNDAVLMSVFYPSEQPFIISTMHACGLQFQSLRCISGNRILLNADGRGVYYDKTVSGGVLRTVPANLWHQKRESARLWFEAVPPYEDNVFRIRPLKYERQFLYVKDRPGGLLDTCEEPGDKGLWKLTALDDNSYRYVLSTKQWPNRFASRGSSPNPGLVFYYIVLGSLCDGIHCKNEEGRWIAINVSTELSDYERNFLFRDNRIDSCFGIPFTNALWAILPDSDELFEALAM